MIPKDLALKNVKVAKAMRIVSTMNPQEFKVFCEQLLVLRLSKHP
jgi:hypothetical protein